jgi:PAS domain S-box-containing protein
MERFFDIADSIQRNTTELKRIWKEDTKDSFIKTSILEFIDELGDAVRKKTMPLSSIEDVFSAFNLFKKTLFKIIEKKGPHPEVATDFIGEAVQLAGNKSESDKRFRQIFEKAGVGISQVDSESMKFVDVNAKLCSLLGYTEEELLTMTVKDITYPEDWPQEQKLIEDLKEKKISSFRREKRYITKKDKVIHVDITVTNYVDSKTSPKMIAVTLDIGKRKKIERELEFSERRLHLITDIQPSLIGQLNKDFHYTFVNQSYEDWFGIPSSEIVGRHIKEIIGEKAFIEIEPFLVSTLLGEKSEYETKIDYDIGSRYVHFTYIPGFDAHHRVRCIYISVVDLTKQKVIIDELFEETILRDRFTSALSHDLRTPLATARLSAELLKVKFADPIIQKFSVKVIENLDRANKMIEDLLDASKIRAGKGLGTEVEEIDLVSVAKKCLEEMIMIHGDRFKLIAPEKLTAFLSPYGIRRIVENLCSNAVKYGEVDKPIYVIIKPEGDHVLLSVKNHGSSLYTIDKKKLFEPYQRGQGHKVESKKGWGIGLTIVKGITEAHFGKVSVENTQDETTFNIDLPLDARYR